MTFSRDAPDPHTRPFFLVCIFVKGSHRHSYRSFTALAAVRQLPSPLVMWHTTISCFRWAHGMILPRLMLVVAQVDRSVGGGFGADLNKGAGGRVVNLCVG